MGRAGRETVAVVLDEPKRLSMRRLELPEPMPGDVIVDVEWSGISTGTERLLWSGSMPPFPGMGYPLVPGYETAGRIAECGSGSRFAPGARVFVPGARCFGEIKGLFGGAASRLVVPEHRIIEIDGTLEEQGVLFALAATAYHAVFAEGARRPDLIVGHGVLGRLIARMTNTVDGPAPVVWESNAERRSGATGYDVIDPDSDTRRDYKSIYDVSGDAGLLDTLIGRLGRGGEITLAGFYNAPLSFAFPPAFMREARIRIASEWTDGDLEAVRRHIAENRLSLDGLITHRCAATRATEAYATAFEDPACLKMLLDWRACS